MNTSQNPCKETLVQSIEKLIIEEMINELYYDIKNSCIKYPAELDNVGVNKYLLTLQTSIRMGVSKKSTEYFVSKLLEPEILKDKRLKQIEKDVFELEDYDKQEFAEQHAKNTLNSYWLRATKK